MVHVALIKIHLKNYHPISQPPREITTTAVVAALLIGNYFEGKEKTSKLAPLGELIPLPGKATFVSFIETAAQTMGMYKHSQARFSMYTYN